MVKPTWVQQPPYMWKVFFYFSIYPLDDMNTVFIQNKKQWNKKEKKYVELMPFN